MRKFALILGFALLLAAPALADETSNATTHIYVVVQPNIAVNYTLASVGLGNIQTGQFCATIRWRVDANTEACRFQVAASALWKGDNINSPVAPLAVDEPTGVTMVAECASPIAGGSPIALFSSSCVIGVFPARMTNPITFESCTWGHFSQWLDTTLCWLQPDHECPQGEYSGFVELYGYVVPSLA